MTEGLKVTVRIPARLQHAHRDDLIVSPVAALVGRVSPGSHLATTESVVTAAGEPIETILEWDVVVADAERFVTSILDLERGMPKGSTVEINGKAATFGDLDALAVYLNGTDLDDEVYADADLQAIVADLQEHLGGIGRMWSYWQGPTETALYFYGPDAAAIRAALEERVAEHPLMQRCRMVELIPLVAEVRDA